MRFKNPLLWLMIAAYVSDIVVSVYALWVWNGSTFFESGPIMRYFADSMTLFIFVKIVSLNLLLLIYDKMDNINLGSGITVASILAIAIIIGYTTITMQGINILYQDWTGSLLYPPIDREFFNVINRGLPY